MPKRGSQSPIEASTVGLQHLRRTSNPRGGESLAARVEKLGGKFSSELGIHLSQGRPSEIFKWFLASILFGARISEAIAVRTYREFEKEELLDPRRIVARGWDGLVSVLAGCGKRIVSHWIIT